nr:hypothetical protein [Tanacetum cinerariifolium]
MVAILEKTEHNIDFHQIVDFLEASHIRRYLKLNDEELISSLPDAELFENLSLMGYNILPNQSNIAIAVVCLATKRVYNFSNMIFDGMVRNINNEPASLSRDDRQGEAFPTISSLDVGQDRENIAKTSAMPHESSPRVPSLDADEGREELGADKSTELGSNDTEEMVNVLSSMEAVNILSSRGAAASVSPADVLPIASVPTFSAIFTTASVVTPYTRRSKVTKKKKLHEQIDAQVAKEIEEEFAKENHRLSEQVARDSEIARIHAKEELKMMIEGLDRSNEVIAKHLSEYKQAEADLSVGEKIKLINKLVKYQDHRAKILKYQAQQCKPLSKKEQREFYMSVLRSHAGWKTKHFRGMTLEHINEKFIPVWKQFEDFVPMSSKEEIPLEEVYIEALQVKQPIIDWEIHSEGRREYWKIFRLGGHTEAYQFFVDMLKKFDREDLHHLWILVKETFSIKQPRSDKEKELWVELKRLFEPDFEDQLWTHHQAFMHDPLDWKLYDTCGVHHVSTKDQKIFMYVVPTGRVEVPTGRYVVPAGNVIIVSHDISFYKQESLLCLACDYISYSPSLIGSKDLSRVGSNKLFEASSPGNLIGDAVSSLEEDC